MPEIVFDDVTFQYPNSSTATLRNLNLTIHSGEKVALVGLNGAGKTTCVKLLLGLYTPTSGRIFIDGIDTTTIPKPILFRLFAPVFQDVWVLPFTIEQNVSTQTVEDTDSDRVIECCKMAGIHDKVSSLPRGYDTPMTRVFDEEGIVLSGGETQKMMLARALYKNAPIIVMDEPTAALDPIAEMELYLAYNEMVGSKTSIYISHRLSSTRFCDRIVLLADGQIQEIGDHDQLMAYGGLYYELYTVQSKYYQEGMDDITERGDTDDV